VALCLCGTFLDESRQNLDKKGRKGEESGFDRMKRETRYSVDGQYNTFAPFYGHKIGKGMRRGRRTTETCRLPIFCLL
jgi:hypothetical protein